MKSHLIKIFSVCIIFAMLFSFMAANAASKLSNFDFSKWEFVGESKIDFEDKAADATYSAPPAGWTFQQAALGPAKVAEADGNKYLQSAGYWQLYSTPIAEKYYTFSVDGFIDGKPNFGFFIRAGQEKFQYDANKSDFFEQDRTGQHDGLSALGGSGMYVRLEGKKVTLYIKLYDDEQPCDIGNKLYAVETNVDFSTGFHKITFVDDGSNAYVYADDDLVARVTFSDPKKYPIGQEEYYSKVVVYGADGTQLGSHDNALFAVNSLVAVGCRNSQFKMDNVVLKTYKDKNPETSDAGVAFITLTVAVGMAVVVLKKRVYA